MFCEKCGAGLRETDRFCSRCGAPVESCKPVEEYWEETRKEPEEIYYDEKLYRDDKDQYRDSFLDKKEEKSHALLVTVSVLLIMAVLAAAFLVMFFFIKKENPVNGREQIEILSNGGQTSGQEGSGDVMILQEDTKQEQTQEEVLNVGAVVTEAQTDPATEMVTEAPEPEIVQGLDIAKIEQILSEESDAVKTAVYVYDLNRNREYATQRCEEPMYASAMICVPILYTAAAQLDQGRITLNDPIPYVNSIGGRGEADPESKEGQNFPLSYYLTTMMSYSDNNCVNCLIDYLGLDTINATCRTAGFLSVDLQRKIVAEVTDGKDNYMSAKDLAGMVRQLYLGKFQTISRDFVKRYFKIDEGDGYRTAIGLADQLPFGIAFLNHNGRGDTRYNEVAVIADETHEYMICVMLNGDYGFSYEKAVKDISNYVYQNLGGETNE